MFPLIPNCFGFASSQRHRTRIKPFLATQSTQARVLVEAVAVEELREAPEHALARRTQNSY